MYKTIDLFAGIGGIRKGFELTGHFKNVLSAENDKYACQTYIHLYGENPNNDVTQEEFKEKVESIDYDTLLAGFPCQSFSRAGNEEGFKDKTRGTLFFDIADIIDRTRPKSFLLENVDNLLSHDKGKTFKIILKTLCLELNYKVIGVEVDDTGNLIYENSNFMRNSKEFGLPQNRPRVYIMGFNKEIYGDKIEDLPYQELPRQRDRGPIINTLSDAIEKGTSKEFYVAQGYFNTLKQHRDRHKSKGNGFGYVVLNLPGEERLYSNALLATGGSGKERNLIYDPQPDFYGLIVKGKKTPLNNEGIRHMTPTEWGKLQGFVGYAFLDEQNNDTFSFPESISNTQRYKQLGNSVTIPVIEEMAYFMIQCLNFLESRH